MQQVHKESHHLHEEASQMRDFKEGNPDFRQ